MPELFLAALPFLLEGGAEAGAGLGLAEAGAGAALGAGEAAAFTLPEIAVTAPALAEAGGAAAGIGTGAAAAGAGAGAGLLGSELSGGLGAALGGQSLMPGFSAGGDPLVSAPGGGVSTGAFGANNLTTTPVSYSPPQPAAANVGTGAAPSAGAPAAPAGIADSPATTGSFGTAGGSDFGADLRGSTLTSGSPTGAGSAAGGPESLGGGSSVNGTTDFAGGSSGSGGLTSGFDKFLTSNLGINTHDLGLITSVGGLGYNLLNRNQPNPGEGQLKNAATSLSATASAQANKGAELESYLQTGTLPPGLQNGVRQAVDAAHSTIKQQYAQRGMSGSSAEAQDLQAASDRALAASQSVALQLLQQGSSMVGQAANTEGMAATLYQAIMHDALSRDQALGSAIGNFAGALAGSGGSSGGSTITLKAA